MKTYSLPFVSVLALAAGGLLIACGAEAPGACKVLCGTEGACPNGLSCAMDGYCYGSDETPGSCTSDQVDGSVVGDSAVDPIDAPIEPADAAIDVDASPCGPSSAYGISEIEVPIPDNDPAITSSVIRIDCDILVSSIQIRIDITHPYRGDIELALDPPGLDYVIIQAADANDARDDIHEVFDLLPVAGQTAAGDWFLDMRDLGNTDAGTLTRWSIGLNQAPP